jgi:ABC-type glycerol-3-phosphate transport system substrate-binding protein
METIRHTRQRMTRRGVLALGAAGAGLAALDPTAVARAVTPRRSPRALRGTLSITWYSYTPSATVKQPQIMYRRYEALHPGVKLTFPPEPTGSLDAETAWVITHGLANRIPDIFSPGNSNMVLSTVPRGWWVDLTPYLDQPNTYVPGNKRWRDLIQPGLLEQGAYYDGRNFLFGADGADAVIFINKDLFTKVGVKVPTTWAELLDASDAFKKAGYSAFLAANSQGYQVAYLALLLESQLWAAEFKKADSTYFMSTGDLIRAVKQRKISKTDPRTKAAWQLLKRWATTWYRGTLTAADFRPFAAGKVAMYFDGTFVLPSLRGAIGHAFELDVMRIPSVTAASSPYAIGDLSTGGNSFSGGNPVAISASAARAGLLDLAIDFLRFYSLPSVIGPMALEGGETPLVKGAAIADPLVLKALHEYIAHPCLLTNATVEMPSELFSKQQALSTGYLAGALDLNTALSQLESVQQRIVDQVIAQAGLHL